MGNLCLKIHFLPLLYPMVLVFTCVAPENGSGCTTLLHTEYTTVLVQGEHHAARDAELPAEPAQLCGRSGPRGVLARVSGTARANIIIKKLPGKSKVGTSSCVLTKFGGSETSDLDPDSNFYFYLDPDPTELQCKALF